MSHAATLWAIQQRGLKPGVKIVLWHLCDRYNPDIGCFPSQESLAADCEISRSTLNEYLSILEAKGLIKRIQRIDPVTRKQQSTRYLLALEPDFDEPQDVVSPCPKSGHGAVSEKAQKPCPEKADSRVRISDTNLVREPVREPSSARVREATDRFYILREAWKSHALPDNIEYARSLFAALPTEADRDTAIAQVPTYLAMMVKRNRKPKLIGYLRDRAWEELATAPPTDKDGEFRITPEREEWPVWMEDIKTRHGELGLRRAGLDGFIIRPTRWPPGREPKQLTLQVAS